MVSKARKVESAAAGTPIANKKSLSRVTMAIPRSHMTILEAEAKAIGVPRSTFLELLLRHQRGTIRLERRKDAPGYSFRQEDFETAETFSWYVNPEVKQLLDQQRLRMGRVPALAWAVDALNEWIGGLPAVTSSGKSKS